MFFFLYGFVSDGKVASHLDEPRTSAHLWRGVSAHDNSQKQRAQEVLTERMRFIFFAKHDDRKGYHYYTTPFVRPSCIVVMTLAVIMRRGRSSCFATLHILQKHTSTS